MCPIALDRTSRCSARFRDLSQMDACCGCAQMPECGGLRKNGCENVWLSHQGEDLGSECGVQQCAKRVQCPVTPRQTWFRSCVDDECRKDDGLACEVERTPVLLARFWYSVFAATRCHHTRFLDLLQFPGRMEH
jgi:hypothetical protein